MIVAADKTTNYYDKCLVENVTKEYMKAEKEGLKIVNQMAAEIATNLKLAGRVQKHTETQCYVTFKDHKNDLMDKKPYRLINPAKTDLGKISKIVMEKLCRELRDKTSLTQ